MPDETIYNLLQVALSLLNQCAALLKQLDQPAQLTYVSSSLPGSTIGKHLRHITDHYALLCHAIVHQQQQQQQIQNSDMPQVDYDARLRNGPAESELEAARESVTATAEKLRQHAKDWTAEQVVRLKAKTPFSVNVGSTVGREVRAFDRRPFSSYGPA